VVSVAIMSTVTVAAFVNKIWSWPNAVVGGLLLLCSILYLMDRLGIGPSLKSRVRDWLDNSGYSIKTIHDSNEFHFVMVDNVGIVTDILQNTPSSPIFIASAKHKANQAQLDAFNRMNEEERRSFWKNVRIELLRYGIEYSDLALDGEGVTLSDALISQRV
jgi:hypothetical protein